MKLNNNIITNNNKCEYCNNKNHKSIYCPNKKKILSKRNYNIFQTEEQCIPKKKIKKNKKNLSPLYYSSDEEE